MSFTNRNWLLAAIYFTDLEDQVMDRLGVDQYHAIGDQYGYPQADAVAALTNALRTNYPNISDDLDDYIFSILDSQAGSLVQKWNLIAQTLADEGVPTAYLGLDSSFGGSTQVVAAPMNNAVAHYLPLLS